MTKIDETTECPDCGAPIAAEADALDIPRPCDACGSTKRVHNVSIMETLVVRDGYGLKAKRPGQKKAHVEDLSMPDYSHSRGKHVHRQRVIDRDNDHYFEKITDYETGEVIHHLRGTAFTTPGTRRCEAEEQPGLTNGISPTAGITQFLCFSLLLKQYHKDCSIPTAAVPGVSAGHSEP